MVQRLVWKIGYSCNGIKHRLLFDCHVGPSNIILIYFIHLKHTWKLCKTHISYLIYIYYNKYVLFLLLLLWLFFVYYYYLLLCLFLWWWFLLFIIIISLIITITTIIIVVFSILHCYIYITYIYIYTYIRRMYLDVWSDHVSCTRLCEPDWTTFDDVHHWQGWAWRILEVASDLSHEHNMHVLIGDCREF